MKFLLPAILLFAWAGCTSTRSSEEKKVSAPAMLTDEARAAADQVVRCINDVSSRSCSLLAEGSITLKDGDYSQSGHFELKSKRLDPTELRRIDSLSMIVSGPFGITGAKFLGAPQEYQFYDAIDGQKYRGKPDPHTLQSLTGMKGITLESLSDVLYGLAPNDVIMPGDSVFLRSASEYRHILYIYRASGKAEAITLNGSLPKNDSVKSKLAVIQYERWNNYRNLRDTGLLSGTPDIAIQYQGLYDYKDFSLPNYIIARSGSTQLEIEYTSADQNPKNLTVKIKMPQ